MSYSKWKITNVDPLQIKLDKLNPRVIINSYSQDNIRNYLIQHFEVLELANSIYHNNGLLPTERILCIKEKKEIIVVEGNRRISALQILKKPSLLPEKYREHLPKIKDVDNFLNKIEVVLAPNRDATEEYITIRHTGTGVKRWSRLAENRRYIIRFEQQNQSINYIAKTLNLSQYQVRRGIRFYYFIEFIKNNLNWTKDEKDIIESPLLETTKIDRFLPFSKKARDVLTINFDRNHKITYQISEKSFQKALQDIVKRTFITNEINTRSTVSEVFNEKVKQICSLGRNEERKTKKKDNNKNRRKTKEGQNKKDKTKSSSKTYETKKQKSQKVKNTPKQNKPIDRTYPFEGIQYSGNVIGISQTLYELHRMNINKFPLSATVLIRTLLECTIQEYIFQNNLDIKIKRNKKIKELSISELLHTCTNKSNENFKKMRNHNRFVARIIKEANNVNDNDELNIVTHGNYREPSANALWDIERRWYFAIKDMIDEISK